MSGTFLDSQGTSGTFFAQKNQPVLTPGTTILNPPIVRQSAGKNTVTLILEKYFGIDPLAQTPGGRVIARAIDGTVTTQYNITVKSGGRTTKLISKRNTLTLKNLSTGRYSVSYTVSGVRNKKKLFTTPKSPTAKFTIPK